MGHNGSDMGPFQEKGPHKMNLTHVMAKAWEAFLKLCSLLDEIPLAETSNGGSG